MSAPRPLILLGLDPGTVNLGYAVMLVPQQYLICSGSVQLCASVARYEDIAAKTCAFMSALRRQIPFDAVVVEEQLRDQMIAVMQSVLTWCAVHEIPCDLVNAARWRKRVGMRATGNYEKNKLAAIPYVQTVFKYSPPSHHAAEAILMAVGTCTALTTRFYVNYLSSL
jgi:Holliday junction resolvasome RuvABC endonuclease subunit